MEKNFGGGSRECGMMVTVGAQGFGKSVETKKIICRYIKDKLNTKVRGRKVLILDTQGEYIGSQFGKDGIPNLDVKTIAVKDVKAWCATNVVEARRIDLSKLHIDDKLKILNYVMQCISNCLVVLEDINKITLTLTHMKDVISRLIGLRHAGVDVIVSFQSLRAVEPRLYDNSQYVRLHYVSGSINNSVAEKVGEPEVFKIAMILIKRRVTQHTNDFRQKKISEGDWKRLRSFFVYVYTKPFKIEGPFTKQEFVEACKKYLQIDKKRIKEEMDTTDCSQEQAIGNQCAELVNEYYGNGDL